MHIAMHCGGMPFNGDTIKKGESLGGSESAAYFVAKELIKFGHEVYLFTNHEQGGNFDGVNYEWIGKPSQQFPLGDRWHKIMTVPHDVCIIQRHQEAFLYPYNSKLNIWWLHDLALRRFIRIVGRHLPFIDAIFCVSEFHRKQVSDIYGINKDFITASSNGVDYSMFEDVSKPYDERKQKHLIFASRPERGLEEVLKLAELMSDYVFHICSYKNVTQQMKGFYDWCWQRADELPNVVNHGFLGKQELYKLISECMMYVYPTSFEDTFNIMILEANAAGTPFIGLNKHAALQQTGKGGGCVWINKTFKYEYGIPEKTKLNERDLLNFKRKIEDICTSKQKWESLHKKALNKRTPWKSVAKQWHNKFLELFEQKTSNIMRLYKHFEQMSDISAIMKHACLQNKDNAVAYIEKYLPDFSKNYYFYLNGDYQTHYDRYYQYEEDRGVKYGPEDLTGNPRFENTFAIVKELNPKTVLDYGCAHGHYVMNLAKRMPESRFIGIDINQKNIDIARNWAKQWINKDNKKINYQLSFGCGEIKTVENYSQEIGKFDLIIAAELLEHVPDVQDICEKLMQHLTPKGYILITVPYGPWEAIGYKDHPGWRAHIHHLERQDLTDIFASQDDFNLRVVHHKNNIGHYILTFRPSGKPLGEINYDRKFKIQNPQQTVSACIIARDSEHTLGETLRKIEPVVDEIIVGVDDQTKDDTRRICEDFGAYHFDIPSPMEVGFDTARNLTIDRAKMDWIFWIDSDEKLENADNLKKYLRQNCFTGYAMRQIHLAFEPTGIIKEDLPCRLFRNHLGIKFFGVIHEHPEKALNKGPGFTFPIGDVGILHIGYTTEQIRRDRFKRNFPLLQKDKEKHPDRQLGKFFMLRDLTHMCRYLRERNGNRITIDIDKYAKDAIKIWRDLLKQKDFRLSNEGLQFYSECVFTLKGPNGIAFQLGFNSTKGERIDDPYAHKINGFFDSKDDINKFVDLYIEEKTKNFEDRYF